jgi:hypothetical protein
MNWNSYHFKEFASLDDAKGCPRLLTTNEPHLNYSGTAPTPQWQQPTSHREAPFSLPLRQARPPRYMSALRLPRS